VLLYVWIASWELECCLDDAIIGNRLGGRLILDPAHPWWSKYASGALPDDVLSLGVTEFDGEVVRPSHEADRPAIATVRSARIGVLGTIEMGLQHFRGRLRYEGHGGGPYDDILEQLDCEGVVRRVRGISYDYELRVNSEGETQVPVAQRAPVEMNSTGDRFAAGRAGSEVSEYPVDVDID
jgi:hypothetical protein